MNMPLVTSGLKTTPTMPASNLAHRMAMNSPSGSFTSSITSSWEKSIGNRQWAMGKKYNKQQEPLLFIVYCLLLVAN
jgi:hypothetical protein